MIWFVSDTHFGHSKIIRWAGRPFRDAEDMERGLRCRWNNAVSEADTVYHLGDFGFGSATELRELLMSLKGKNKIIVAGNHDRGYNALYAMGWNAVIKEATIALEGHRIVLSHRPLDFLPDGASAVIHGHTHLSHPDDLHRAGENPYIPPFNVNICVEGTNYAPVNFKWIRRKLREQGVRL